MLSTPLWAYRNSLNTAYVITNHRAITIDGGGSFTIRSFPPKKLQNIFRREHRNGTGDVIIPRDYLDDDDSHQLLQELGFLRIQDAKAVESMLKELSKQAAETDSHYS